jgi:hypothetical protein
MLVVFQKALRKSVYFINKKPFFAEGLFAYQRLKKYKRVIITQGEL